MVYEHKFEKSSELLCQIVYDTSYISNPEVLERVIYSLLKHVRMCFQAEHSHSEYLLETELYN
jgi:hypothetical protein